MIPLLAQNSHAISQDSMLPYLVVGIVVVGLSSLVQLALAAKQLFGGNKGERQIEPTQIAALQSEMRDNHAQNQKELKEQTKTLGDIKGEVGIVKAKVEIVEKNVDGFHQRVGGISRELSATTARIDELSGLGREVAGIGARVDGLEKREMK